MSEAESAGNLGPRSSFQACLRNLQSLRDQIITKWPEQTSDLQAEEHAAFHRELAATCELLRALTKPRDASLGSSSVVVTEDHIDSLLHARRARADIFNANIFSDPAWDILLELYAARLGKRGVTAEELARAIRLPSSTTGRWITSLKQKGLVQASVKISDQASLFLGLTEEAALRMDGLARKWTTAFVAI